MADTIRQCDGLVDEMSYWTFSDVFEEQGVVKKPFYGGYGLVAAGRYSEARFTAFKILHLLGHERLAVNSDFAIVTRGGWPPGGRCVELVSPDTIRGSVGKTVLMKIKNQSEPAVHTSPGRWRARRSASGLRKDGIARSIRPRRSCRNRESLLKWKPPSNWN